MLSRRNFGFGFLCTNVAVQKLLNALRTGKMKASSKERLVLLPTFRDRPNIMNRGKPTARHVDEN